MTDADPLVLTPHPVDRRLRRRIWFERRNRDSAISSSSAVLGLRPVRAARSRTSHVPKAGNDSESPFFSVSEIIFTIAFTARSAAAQVPPVFAAIASTSSFLFMFAIGFRY
jgi:hypothetical protein